MAHSRSFLKKQSKCLELDLETQGPRKYPVCHNFILTNVLRSSRGIHVSSLCSMVLWKAMGSNTANFYQFSNPMNWIRHFGKDSDKHFLATLWWNWRHRNL
ncbi:hypothetical protein Lal_00014674 [Lupinus albus]|nr:hypothetical protein Lal_00014674 [Lupinus albus]